MKLKVAVIVAALMVPIAAWAALKTWSNGEVIKAADLNSNFNQVNAAATALITDAKVSSSAAISHSKLATPALVPKAWAVVSLCTTGTCTVPAKSQIASVTRTGLGTYTVALSYLATNANYAMLVTSTGGATPCGGNTATTGGFTVSCTNDSGFSLLVMDDN